MANIKSATKNARKNLRRQARNQRVKSRLKTLAKGLAKAKASDDAGTAKKAAQDFISALDKAVNKGIIHRNSASRHKAACAKLLLPK